MKYLILTILTAVAVGCSAAWAQSDLVKHAAGHAHGHALDDIYTQLRYVRTTDYGASWSGPQQAGDLSVFAPRMGMFMDFSAITTDQNELAYAIYLNEAATPGVYSLTGPLFTPVLVMAEGTNNFHSVGGVLASGWTDIGKTPNGDLFVLIWGQTSAGVNTFWGVKSTDDGQTWETPFVIATVPEIDATAMYPHLSQMNSATNVFLIYQSTSGTSYNQYVGRFPVAGGAATFVQIGSTTEAQRSYYVGACTPIAYDPDNSALYCCYLQNISGIGCKVYYSNNQGQTFVDYTLTAVTRYPSVCLRSADQMPFIVSNYSPPQTGVVHSAWITNDALGYGGGFWVSPPDTLARAPGPYDGVSPLLYLNQAYFWDAVHGVAMHNLWGQFTPQGLYTSRTIDGGIQWMDFGARWLEATDSLSPGLSTMNELVGGTNGVAYVSFSGIYAGTTTYATVSGTVTTSDGIGDVTQATVSADGIGAPFTHPSADGSYTLTNVQTGARLIAAFLNGYGEGDSAVVVPVGGLTNLNFTLQSNCQNGNVSGIWRRADSLIFVCGDVTVPAGDTLIIEAGVRVQFLGAYQFMVHGLLQAIGSIPDTIRFTSDTTSVPLWHGIRFENAHDSSRIEYAVVEHAGPGDMGDQMGGLGISGCSPTFVHCDLRHNTGIFGGGVSCLDSANARFDNCRFANFAVGNGAYVYRSAPVFYSCSFVSNTHNTGAGIWCDSSAGVFDRCLIADNYAATGGGIQCQNGSTTCFSNCVISGNHTAAMGGGAYLDSPITLTNCSFIGNRSDGSYAAVFCIGSAQNIENCVVAFSSGPGISYGQGCDSTRIRNSDVFGNVGEPFHAYGVPVRPGLGVLSMTNANGDSCDPYHNILLNPMFVDTAARNYHLADSSRCIGAADTAGIPLTDYDGNPRPNPAGTLPDIGAFENPHGTPPSAVGSTAVIPREFRFTCYPNPFNPEATLLFALPQASRVKVTLFDITGRALRTVTEERFEAGEHSVRLNGRALPSGVYFVRIETSSQTRTAKLVLLK